MNYLIPCSTNLEEFPMSMEKEEFRILLPLMSHMCLIGDKFGDFAGHGEKINIEILESFRSNPLQGDPINSGGNCI